MCSSSLKRNWQNHAGLVLDAVEGFDVIDCEACRFRHIVPIPRPEDLQQVYRQDYYSVEKPLYIERYREDLAWWNLVYSERYSFFEQHLPVERRRILDVGSGPGYFLLHGKNRGWTTLGIEPSKQAAEHSRTLGIEIIDQFFDEATARRVGRFDVVNMQEVLEHCPEPEESLRLAYECLEAGGLICVVVPNDYNLLQGALRQKLGFAPWWVVPPHHINYFDLESICRLLEKTGFIVANRSGTFPMEIFLLMGQNYVGNDSIGRAMHRMRKNLELTLASGGTEGLLAELYSVLSERGIGRECVVMAER